MKISEQIYCSLDIETSGFDPLTNEILEVGFAFFELTSKGAKISEEWTQVFKPSKEVAPQILGLTGISQTELDEAPGFGEHRDFIQKKIGDAIIVGHNVSFDIKFLEAFGIKFSGGSIDTLDLVQFILPTHHSYNLENLMHTFGIKHKEAHRALPDAKATITILEKLLGVYEGFPLRLKTAVQSLIKKHPTPWQNLLGAELPVVKLENNKKIPQSPAQFKLALENKRLYNLSAAGDFLPDLAMALSQQKEKILLVVPSLSQVMALWKKGCGEAVLSEELLFNGKKFEKALKKEILTLEEVKFLLKILVWQSTNWQTKTILDLNLSFFGGQFRELISGGNTVEQKQPQLLCVEQKTFLELSRKKLFKDRVLCIFGLNEFEQACSFNIGIRVGWGQIIYALKNIYNPELALGEASKKEKVLEMLSAADLFFGLASGLLKSGQEGFSYFKIDEAAEVSENYSKVKKAAANFADKLDQAAAELKSETLKRYADNLQDFFAQQENRVKWVELAEGRCIFYSSPIEIEGIVKEILSPYKKISLFDSLGVPLLANYFLTRLGLQDFEPEQILPKKKNLKEKFSLQGDLFADSRLKARSKVQCFCRLLPHSLPEEELLGILTKEALPAVVLFSSALNAKQFYNQHYRQLKEISSVFLQSSSGGSNKILRNFQIHGNSLLLATDRFILKFLTNQGLLDAVERLAVKTLIINRLPFENYTHPYQEAVSKQYEDSFLDFALPKALYNFHALLKFFNTEKLENLYIYDPKLEKGYAKVFKEYLAKIEGFSIL